MYEYMHKQTCSDLHTGACVHVHNSKLAHTYTGLTLNDILHTIFNNLDFIPFFCNLFFTFNNILAYYGQPFKQEPVDIPHSIIL